MRGFGVIALPFSSGHILSLRVFPENDFAPYRAIWHRTPAGAWSIYVDGPRLDAACPRYYGSATAHTALASIALQWTGPASFRVHMPEPLLDWRVSLYESPLLRVINVVHPRLPAATWRSTALVSAREFMIRRLGMGAVRLRHSVPNGQQARMMPQRIYLIDSSSAQLNGEDLGQPTTLADNPVIGNTVMPARGVFAFGRTTFTTKDRREYTQTIEELTAIG